MTTLLEVSAQLEPLVYKVARFPDPAHSGAEGAEVLARISLLVFGRIPTTEETQRLGVLMGHCLAAGKLLSLPSPRGTSSNNKPGSVPASVPRKEHP